MDAFAIVGAVALAWLLFVGYRRFWPSRKCRRCRGRKMLAAPLSTMRYRTCPRCRGTGKR